MRSAAILAPNRPTSSWTAFTITKLKGNMILFSFNLTNTCEVMKPPILSSSALPQ